MGMLRRGASSMSLATLPFDYYTHNNPLPSADTAGVSRSQSVDYEQYCDTASEAESETVMMITVFFYFSFESQLLKQYLWGLCRPPKR